MRYDIRRYIAKQRRKGVREQDILEAAIEVGYEEEAVLQEMRATTRNKATRYAALVIAVILSLSAVTLIHNQQMNISEQMQPPTTQPVEQEERLQETLISNDPAECGELQGELREECEELLQVEEPQEQSEQDEILNQALRQNNPALCAQLNEELRAECEAILQ